MMKISKQHNSTSKKKKTNKSTMKELKHEKKLNLYTCTGNIYIIGAIYFNKWKVEVFPT